MNKLTISDLFFVDLMRCFFFDCHNLWHTRISV